MTEQPPPPTGDRIPRDADGTATANESRGSDRREPRRARDGGPAGTTTTMANIAGVRLRPGGRSFTCDAGKLSLHVGTRVVAQADRGPEIGIVTVAPALRPVVGRLARILRVAEPRDLERAASEDERVAEALDFARQTVRERNLAVKVFHAEIHGGGRATLYFASEARIDFRDLVRLLSDRLHLRVEMRQVGVRDEAKMVGGIGSCGRELCCSTFLQRFAPISIKAAKNQNIALTPSKVTGQCGRLKCCLVYEEANYVEAAKNLPRLGKRVETPDGVGRVGDLDVLRGRVRVLFQDGPPKVYQGDEVRMAAAPPEGGGGGGGGAGQPNSPAPRDDNRNRGRGEGGRGGGRGDGGGGGGGGNDNSPR
ncbi:MAG: regulatory iron-sulfur-containing complex subunit RicT [Haliangium ochraceum]